VILHGGDRAKYREVDLSLEHRITREAEESLLRRSEREGAEAAGARGRLAHEDSEGLTASLAAIAAMSAAEEVERKEQELAAINKRISELEASGQAPAAAAGGGGSPDAAGPPSLAPTDRDPRTLAPADAAQAISRTVPAPPPPPPAYQKEESEDLPLFDFAAQRAHSQQTIPASASGATQWAPPPPPPPPAYDSLPPAPASQQTAPPAPPAVNNVSGGAHRESAVQIQMVHRWLPRLLACLGSGFGFRAEGLKDPDGAQEAARTRWLRVSGVRGQGSGVPPGCVARVVRCLGWF